MGCGASKEPERRKTSWFGPFGLHTPSILGAISFPFQVYDPLNFGKVHSDVPNQMKLAKATRMHQVQDNLASETAI
ncbi:hypothetical protein R1flu_009111 [Riccia fluitans]|uniref:Uncharacterized protein n=1 Tax=Riccia fluitans TaxID=41844 RepID=A0ABD1Z3N8_9MARC